MRRILGITLAAATATTVGLGLGATTAQAAEGSVLYAGAAGAIKDSYLVVFKDNTMSAASVSDQVARCIGSFERCAGDRWIGCQSGRL